MDDSLDFAEFFTHQHRIVGRVRLGGLRLTDVLNDDLASSVELTTVEISRHLSPEKVVAAHASALLDKKGILFAISGAQSGSAAERSFFKHVDTTEWEVLVTVPFFELRGKFHVRGTGDLKRMLLSWTGQFIPLTQATAVFTLYPQVTFTGDVIIVNREHTELICSDEVLSR
jgi:hypothetical protein